MDTTLKLPARPLGSIGISVSVLGLGTVKFGRNQGIKYAPFALPSDEVIEQLLDDARAYGVNLLDTAPAYGAAEERLGKLLGNRRDQFVIVGKTGEEFAGGVSTYDFSEKHTRESVQRSLKRLRTDRLDCVLVHCPHDDLAALRDTPVLETLERLKEAGDILSFGASTYSLEAGMLALSAADVIMITITVGDKNDEAILRRASELRKGVLVKKAFGSGNVTGGWTPESLKKHVESLLSPPAVSSLMIGTIDREHFRRDVRAALASNCRRSGRAAS